MKLRRRHRNRSRVISLWYAQVLLIDIHKLDVILAQPITFAALEDQIHNIRRILRLQRQYVLILRASQHLHERGEIDAQGDVAVTAERGEGFGLEHHGDEGDVGVVHGLKCNAGVIAVEVAILHEVFYGVNDLVAA